MLKFLITSLSVISAGTAFALNTQPLEQNHSMIAGPFNELSEVTSQCLICHPKQGEDILRSSHWNWKRTRNINGRDEVYSKKNGLTTFALAAGANPTQCLTCHISGNLLDQKFDPTSAVNIDCLVCHDTTGTYKRSAGRPAQSVDLLLVAKNVGKPTPGNCMTCHGTGEKATGRKIHSGIERDIHLQESGASMNCQSCHPSEGRHAFTRTLTSSPGLKRSTGCAVCHTEAPHKQSRLNNHAEIISCKTCHIPKYGIDTPAVFSWNWISNKTEPVFQYNQWTSSPLIDGNGIFQAKNIQPVYLWDNGTDEVYQRGAKAIAGVGNVLQQPTPRTSQSKISPFSVTYGTQLIDAKYRYLISPTLSPNGTMEFLNNNWNDAAKDGMNKLRLPFSGEAVFTTTVTYRRVNHGSVPAAEALDCMDCHGKLNRLNWQKLGYTQDPWQESQPGAGTPSLQPQQGEQQEGRPALPPIRETILPGDETVTN